MRKEERWILRIGSLTRGDERNRKIKAARGEDENDTSGDVIDNITAGDVECSCPCRREEEDLVQWEQGTKKGYMAPLRKEEKKKKTKKQKKITFSNFQNAE